MPKTFFISDLHFGHKNVLKYEPVRIDATLEYMTKVAKIQHNFTREDVLNDYNNAPEDQLILKDVLHYHNEMLIYNWNKVVGKNDTVWFLGDFAFGPQKDIEDIITRKETKVVKFNLDQCDGINPHTGEITETKLVSRLNGHKRMVKGNHDNLPDEAYMKWGFEYVSKYPIILKKFFCLSHEPMEWMNPNSSPFYFIFGHVHSMPQFTTETDNSRCVCVERQNFTPIRIEAFDKYNPIPAHLDPHKKIKEI